MYPVSWSCRKLYTCLKAKREGGQKLTAASSWQLPKMLSASIHCSCERPIKTKRRGKKWYWQCMSWKLEQYHSITVSRMMFSTWPLEGGPEDFCSDTTESCQERTQLILVSVSVSLFMFSCGQLCLFRSIDSLRENLLDYLVYVELLSTNWTMWIDELSQSSGSGLNLNIWWISVESRGVVFVTLPPRWKSVVTGRNVCGWNEVKLVEVLGII